MEVGKVKSEGNLDYYTYVAEGEIWRCLSHRAGIHISRVEAIRVSLTKLFVDQAVPSAGLSGTLLVSRALSAHAVSHGAITATVVVRIVSYYAAYLLCLGAALLIAIFRGQASELVVLVSAGFAIFAITLSVGALMFVGHEFDRMRRSLSRVKSVRIVFDLLRNADRRIARSRTLLLKTTLLQLCIVALDASTVWMLIASLGSIPAPASVFASFMISTLFRSIGILPGGLGSYEAASVVTLKLIGVPLPVALSATLVFRGLSFWLPMLPGFWCSRRVLKGV